MLDCILPIVPAISLRTGFLVHETAIHLIDVFHFLMVIVFVVSPLVFLMRKSDGESAPAGAGH